MGHIFQGEVEGNVKRHTFQERVLVERKKRIRKNRIGMHPKENRGHTSQ
jgi:hypothetical protein